VIDKELNPCGQFHGAGKKHPEVSLLTFYQMLRIMSWFIGAFALQDGL
jgi:hypothetical protein